LFGAVALFDKSGKSEIDAAGKSVDYEYRIAARQVRRIGYDLFAEIRSLLTDGQPAAYAQVPTLELHIALMRQWLVEANVPFVEILPRPAGHSFICCLTHDVDFFGVRRQGLDRTTAGFAVRASMGTLIDLLRGRRTWREAAGNARALMQLPFVLLGLARDFWRPFDDYAACERPECSTFFLVPFKDRAGVAPDGGTDARRAVRYQTSDIAEEAQQAIARGSELGVHGIEAWQGADAAESERQAVETVVPTRGGVRMHWLYFSPPSPQHLEAGGFEYDSTWGYNDAVGYRAGTSQVFRWLQTDHLMELPLTIMDSALLSRERMALDVTAAVAIGRRLISQAVRFGGTLVVNWHCRSLAPERQWRRPYEALITEATGAGAWFATGASAVAWFRWRRSIGFSETRNGSVVRVTATVASTMAPGAVVRIHGADHHSDVLDGSKPATWTLRHPRTPPMQQQPIAVGEPVAT
jgi:hypothetical protein